MLRIAYDAFSNGEINTLRDMFTDDISWHASGDSPVAGDYSGKDGVLQFFASMMAVYSGDSRTSETCWPATIAVWS